MIDRYQGDEGRRLLVEALRAQTFVDGNLELAQAVSEISYLEQVEPGQHVIDQGASDNDLVLIISGSLSIHVNGRKVAERRSGQHVGEMALIDATARRSATVIANEQTVLARISETNFSKFAQRHHHVWRLLGIEMARRLRERSKFITVPNEKPLVFIGSSRESLDIARAIEVGLSGDIVVRIWTSGVFEASKTSIESLEKEARMADFGVLVFAGDDNVFSRGVDYAAPRDNVIFELGLFMGSLTRSRTFIVLPKGAELKIPTDLLGVTPIDFESSGDGGYLAERLKPVCDELSAIIEKLGSK
jgi:predicted nucleotide-binding protein